MTPTVLLVDMLFGGMFGGFVILQLAAFLFFGIAILLRRLTPEPVERIRITMTAFGAILVMFVTIMIPFAPRWSIAVWHEPATVSREQPPAETVPLTVLPPVLPREMISIPMAHVSQENATLHETAGSSHVDLRSTDLDFVEQARPLTGVLFAKCCVLAVFLTVSLVMIVFYLVALVRLRRIMQTAVAAPEWVEELFRDQVAGYRNTVKVRVSPKIDSPLLCGVFRPVILLPVSMTREENAVQTRYALAHEWAHHQRGDLATWCFVHFCRVLFWVQPFYWHLAKELRVDQDFLADDSASQSKLNSNTDAENYALVLLELAKRRIISTAVGRSPALGFAETPPSLTRSRL